MLHLDAVYPGTLELLKQIMGLPVANGFDLAGGTALALQIGHRISVDLDFFGAKNLNSEEILNALTEIDQPSILSQSKNILILNVSGVKVDFVNYQYPLLSPANEIEGIRLLSLLDIAAMKLAAIAGRGKKRDFFDLYFLSKHYSLEQLIASYNKKFSDGSEFMIIKSLVYFEDAEMDADPVLLIDAQWSEVKAFFQKEVYRLYR